MKNFPTKITNHRGIIRNSGNTGFYGHCSAKIRKHRERVNGFAAPAWRDSGDKAGNSWGKGQCGRYAGGMRADRSPPHAWSRMSCGDAGGERDTPDTGKGRAPPSRPSGRSFRP